MTGFLRNLFGTYKIYDSPDYEDLVPKFAHVEKYAIYFSGCLAVVDIAFLGKTPPKGALAITKQAMKFIGPAAAAGATFVGTLYASAHLRGKNNDEWNSVFATLASGALYAKMVPGPWVFINYCALVGLGSNFYKQARLHNYKLSDQESQMKARKEAYITGPFLTDWTVYNPKDYPPKWINGDELEAKSQL